MTGAQQPAPHLPDAHLPGAPFFRSQLLREVAGNTLRPGGLALTRRLLGRLGLTPGSRLLDVGCGPGASAALAAEMPGVAVTALDPCPDFLAQARAAHPGIRLVRGRAEALPLASGSQDAVLCECVLSVTANRAAALAEMARVLMPQGLLALADLHARAAAEGASRAAGCAAGALPLDALLAELAAHALVVMAVEDHSRALAELAARLIFAGLPSRALGGPCSGSRPGYALVLARKEARP